MVRNVVRRLLLALPVLFGVLLLGFLLMQVVPNDPAVVRAGPTATLDVIEAIRSDLGLDRPLVVQFGLYLSRLLRGDLGLSNVNNMPVATELGNTLGPTLELIVASLAWSMPLGVALGTWSASRHGSWIDRAIMAVSVAGVSVPVFLVGLGLVWLFGFHWQVLPVTGRTGPIWTPQGLAGLALPALTLGGAFIGPVARMTRSAVIEALGAHHVRTARAKGVAERDVVLRHALRNALIPVVTLIGLQIGFLLGGAVVVETIFAWPGIGRLAVGAILSGDAPMAQGTIIVLSAGFILINLAVDMLYAVLDPRVGYA